jgi:quercetin dioxygenase-like cupin family protein
VAENSDRIRRDSLVKKVFDPASLVEYQDGAVVSRTVIDKPTGTITLFAFDRGETLSEHTAPFDAVVQVVDGEGEFTISGSVFRVAAGQALIMPAGEPHSVAARERFKMLLTMVRS